MDLVQLAKDWESGRVGCPSVWHDAEQGWDRARVDLLVQGDGMVGGDGLALVRIKAGIVAEALGGWAADLDVPYDELLAVSGVEFDVTLLPHPLPGERAVWSTAEELRRLLRDEAAVDAAPARLA